MDKFFTKDNITIAVIVVIMLIQANYFATKLDVSNLENQLLKVKAELQTYSDNGDKEILRELDVKYEKIMNKLDKLR